MVGRGSGSRQGKGRLEAWSTPCTHGPPTTSNAPISATPITATTSTPPSCPPQSQEFVMIPNPRYVELGFQPSFPPQPTFGALHLRPHL